jgi:hypothetical protein
MPHVFISHRNVQPDQELAVKCARFLEANRFTVFLDTRTRIGQQWIEEINRQLNQSQYFVVLLSAKSIRSDVVSQEVRLAHELHKKGQLRIFPIRIDFTGALPYDLAFCLNGIKHQIWNQGQPFDPIFEAVLQDINQPAGGSQPEELRSAPLPAPDPRLETGALALDTPFYIRRPADDRVARAIAQRPGTILVRGPGQVGNTSLLVRAHALARDNGQRTLYIDFQLLDESNLKSLKSLLLCLAHYIARKLRTTIKPKDVWDDMLGAPESFTSFVEDAVLKGTETRLLITLDEVDRIFRLRMSRWLFRDASSLAYFTRE